MTTFQRHLDNLKTILKRLFCDHKWNWWCNKRKLEKQIDVDRRLRFNASDWYCNKCHKMQERDYPYYG